MCDRLLDAAFPGSKFILTVRSSGEEWYESLTRFQAMRVEKRTGIRRLPTVDDWKTDPYIYPGYLWRVRELVGGPTNENNLYDKEALIYDYHNHNSQIINYSRHRRDDLLVLCLSDQDSMQKLCKFLGKRFEGQEMPHVNRSCSSSLA
jgi:hypothetical protein